MKIKVAILVFCFGFLSGCGIQKELNDKEPTQETQEIPSIENIKETEYTKDIQEKIEQYETFFGKGFVNYDGEGSFYINNKLIYFLAENITIQQLIDFLEPYDIENITDDSLGVGEIYFKDNKTHNEIEECIKSIEESGLVELCVIDSIVEISPNEIY